MNGTDVLVVAHPDDEALWLSSVLARVQKVIFCFGDFLGQAELSRQRDAAVAELPLPNISYLALPQAGVFNAVDWSRPRLTENGLAITDAAAHERYAANYRRLLAELPALLEGAGNVYTHNPWGEYGHAEHVQVHHAVHALQQRLGYSLAFSNYIGTASEGLAFQIAADYGWDEQQRLPTDHRLAKRLRDVYRRHGVWTWNARHRWPRFETLYVRHGGEEHVHRSLAGNSVLRVEGLRWPPSLRHRVRHRLPLAV